ncbi:hypothetical protein BD779DRAFT_996088 [Infundibulicybe gibba]|nr:hypothetical protein BD779DRAFT_996088 [Infundibulicybe gibba]
MSPHETGAGRGKLRRKVTGRAANQPIAQPTSSSDDSTPAPRWKTRRSRGMTKTHMSSEEEPDAMDVEESVGEPSNGGDANTRSASLVPTAADQPRLKIKLKIPQRASTRSTPTPPVVSKARTQTRDRNMEVDVESEDEDDEDIEEEEEELSRSTSVAAGSTRPMTTRQAVLASVVDSTHVSLDEGRSKKKTLNESELALRREETARKRKNLSEKKLEDEKAETINRLLKKQSRPKNKRMTTATSDIHNASPAPNQPSTGVMEDGSDRDSFEKPEPMLPSTYRWVSRAQTDPAGQTHLSLTFSIPTSVFTAAGPREPGLMDIDPGPETKPGPDICAADGCDKVRKYRLVKNWTIGACGMEHLKLLEGK